MTVLARTLFEATQLPATDSTLYTAPVGTRALIDKMTITNTTAGALTVSINIVAAAGAVGAGNRVVSVQSIAANTTYLCPEIVGQILNPGDFISAIASAATSLVARISGREVS